MLLNFNDADEKYFWLTINDDVMGGVSKGRIELLQSQMLLFKGYLSLDHNGGFVSVRRQLIPAALAGYRGIMLRVKGDGQAYQLRVRTDDQYDGIAYRSVFSTYANQWLTLTQPFSLFRASFRGRILPTAPILDPAQIRQLGFLLADKKQGFFHLEVAWIQSY